MGCWLVLCRRAEPAAAAREISIFGEERRRGGARNFIDGDGLEGEFP